MRALVVGVGHEAPVVLQHRGNDAGRPVGRRGHHPAAGGVLFVDRQGPQVDPVDDHQRVGRRRARSALSLRDKRRRAPLHLEPAGENALALAAPLHAGVHRRGDLQQARAHLGLGAQRLLVLEHQRGDGEPVRARTGPAARRRSRTGRDSAIGGARRHLLHRVALLVDHEAAAHRVVDLLQQQRVATVGREAHAVAEQGQLLAPVKDDRLGRLEGHRRARPAASRCRSR